MKLQYSLLRLLLVLSLGLPQIGCDSQQSNSKSDDGQPAATPGGSARQKLRLAVIPKGTTHVFWNSVEAGAKRAADELGVEIIWKGPLKESDRAQQIQVVQQFVAEGVDGIALAPLDSKALLGPVKAAAAKEIPIVIFDSALDGEAGKDFVSFVATDNKQGGRLGGEQLADLLGGNGNVVLLRYMVGSASTTNRESGFLEAIAKHNGLEITVDNRFAGATAGEAQTAALNMIDDLRAAEGVFASNESATNGLLQALRKEKLAGNIKFVGFDASPPLVGALEQGEIDALVVQNPEKMGYLAVKTLVDHLNGKSVPAYLDTGVSVVTRKNMNDPEIAPLIK